MNRNAWLRAGLYPRSNEESILGGDVEGIVQEQFVRCLGGSVDGQFQLDRFILDTSGLKSTIERLTKIVIDMDGQ